MLQKRKEGTCIWTKNRRWERIGVDPVEFDLLTFEHSLVEQNVKRRGSPLWRKKHEQRSKDGLVNYHKAVKTNQSENKMIFKALIK